MLNGRRKLSRDDTRHPPASTLPEPLSDQGPHRLVGSPYGYQPMFRSSDSYLAATDARFFKDAGDPRGSSARARSRGVEPDSGKCRRARPVRAEIV